MAFVDRSALNFDLLVQQYLLTLLVCIASIVACLLLLVAVRQPHLLRRLLGLLCLCGRSSPGAPALPVTAAFLLSALA